MRVVVVEPDTDADQRDCPERRGTPGAVEEHDAGDDEEQDRQPGGRPAKVLEESLADRRLLPFLGDQHPAEQVEEDTEAAGDADDHEGDADPQRLDAEVGGEAAGHAGDLAVGAAADERRSRPALRLLPAGVRPRLALRGAVHGFLL